MHAPKPVRPKPKCVRGRYTGAKIPTSVPNTLFLVFTQEEKENLHHLGYGTGEGSRLLTVHEAQGLTYGTVIILRSTARKLQLHDSVQHAVVAVSRHTAECAYYTDDRQDATARLILRATNAPTDKIIAYNTKMAMRNRDAAIVEVS
ncbi:Replicase large subunit [Papilio machaon]|uniref:Replicase large subunit n=1 Tax=Papilio machaon TaxID=76193 RepID=A0A0N1IEJ4_PAPMA|nr:Replicase large subunit [Papilio machaon]